MSKKLSKIKPAWHAEAAGMLRENFGKIHAAFLAATERAVWLGLFLNDIKYRGKEDGSIPHGQFCQWLEANVPELSRSQVTVYMSLAVNVAEKAEFQIADFRQFATGGTLPPQVQKLVEGKTQSQLFLEFKQAEPDQFGDLKPKVGRLKGHGGASKLQRISAREALAKLTAESCELRAEETARWLTEVSDDTHLGLIGDAAAESLADACDFACRYLRRVIAARHTAARAEREDA